MLADDGVGAPGVALRLLGRGDNRPWASSTPAGGGRGRGEVISKGRGLLTLENCSDVLAANKRGMKQKGTVRKACAAISTTKGPGFVSGETDITE